MTLGPAPAKPGQRIAKNSNSLYKLCDTWCAELSEQNTDIETKDPAQWIFSSLSLSICIYRLAGFKPLFKCHYSSPEWQCHTIPAIWPAVPLCKCINLGNAFLILTTYRLSDYSRKWPRWGLLFLHIFYVYMCASLSCHSDNAARRRSP